MGRVRLENRATETLNGARSLLETLDSEDAAAGHREYLTRATASLEEAEEAWEQGLFRSALYKAQISRGLLLDVLDSVQNPGRRGEARFIYVEGDVEYRRGETGRFRRGEPAASSTKTITSARPIRARPRSSSTVTAPCSPSGREPCSRSRPGCGRGGRGEPVRIEYGWVDLETSRRPSGVETEFAAIRLETDSEATITYEQTSAPAVRGGKGTAQVARPERGSPAPRPARAGHAAAGKAHSTTGLLDPPAVVAPANGFDLNLDKSRELVLSWDQVKDADGYQLQISRSRLFGDAVVDRRRVKTSATLGVNDEGNYFWRVAAYGPDGSLGPWSSLRKFRALSPDGIGWKDTVPPLLQVAKMMVNGNIVIITGKTEPGVRVEIEGQRAPVSADGTFSLSVTPETEGLVDVQVSAVDASGNRTETKQRVFIETL